MSRSVDEERRDERAVAKNICTTRPARNNKLWPDFKDYLGWRGLSYGVAVYNGWYPSTSAGDTVERLVIPATASDGHNKYWQARAMLTEVPPDVKRWQSPAASREDALIICWPINSTPKACAIVEGPLDALAAAEAGLLGVGLMGVSPPGEALGLANVLTSGLRLWLVWDADAPEPWMEIWKRFISFKREVTLKDAYPHKDLADVPLIKRVEMFR